MKVCTEFALHPISTILSMNGKIVNEILTYENDKGKIKECLSNSGKMSFCHITLLYENESWECQEKHKRKLKAIRISNLRSVCNKTWTEKIQNQCALSTEYQ